MVNLENDIDRFIIAQDNKCKGYNQALKEVKNGRKISHWIWYIFPQLRGLGHSRNSYYYGIRDREEAFFYITNPMLRMRMYEITKTLLEHQDKTACEIFGYIDTMKVKSCMTLFDCIEPNGIFNRVLQVFYDGKRYIKSLV